jgi:hypothetical protein
MIIGAKKICKYMNKYKQIFSIVKFNIVKFNYLIKYASKYG